MKITFAGEALPFPSPTYVTARYVASEPTPFSDEEIGTVTVPLQMLEAPTLAALCDEFRIAVFANAGKPLPPSAAEYARPDVNPALRLLGEIEANAGRGAPVGAMIDRLSEILRRL